MGGPGVAADQKGAAAESAWLVFFDESAVSLIPPMRRTWSPRGRTPVLRHRFGWKKASQPPRCSSRSRSSTRRILPEMVLGRSTARAVKGPWRWCHRWWVMLGGVLVALIVGALALGAFQS
jgi:hypothetical protein